MQRRGVWVVLEGPDGVGKTTVARFLKEELEAQGIDKVVVVREPSEGPIGRLIREWVLREDPRPQIVHALLFIADSVYQVYNQVLPLRQQGYVIVQERYSKVSELCYQVARGCPEDIIKALVSSLPDPDICVVLMLPWDKLVERVRQLRRDVYEADLAFIKRVYDRYIQVARELELAVIENWDSRATARELAKLIIDMLS